MAYILTLEPLNYSTYCGMNVVPLEATRKQAVYIPIIITMWQTPNLEKSAHNVTNDRVL
jgi:hypothetical protein